MELQQLTKRLAAINESLARKIDTKNEYDKVGRGRGCCGGTGYSTRATAIGAVKYLPAASGYELTCAAESGSRHP